MLRSIYFAAVCSDSRTFLLARLLGDVRALIRRSPIARRAFPWSLVFTRIAFNVPLEFLLRGKNPCILVGLWAKILQGKAVAHVCCGRVQNCLSIKAGRAVRLLPKFEGEICLPNFVHSGTGVVCTIFGLF